MRASTVKYKSNEQEIDCGPSWRFTSETSLEQLGPAKAAPCQQYFAGSIQFKGYLSTFSYLI
ncbi:hypothetical protein KFK09_025296 [Dendrobium nobile]|uniref:Uncharacterized protein n=1 Tax=Dendrobium nobile TaxID=94219 RepID=A0A8T3AFS1_DENNO|nr:hypothetical protein KFK09_025296 [Dendrobium nobile]